MKEYKKITIILSNNHMHLLLKVLHNGLHIAERNILFESNKEDIKENRKENKDLLNMWKRTHEDYEYMIKAFDNAWEKVIIK